MLFKWKAVLFMQKSAKTCAGQVVLQPILTKSCRLQDPEVQRAIRQWLITDWFSCLFAGLNFLSGA
jgi:hypothetical protein